MGTHRTTPDHDNEGWPAGVPYIIGNEGCERFSFYGMKAILFVHLLSLYVIARQSVDVVVEKCAALGTDAGRALADKMHDVGQTMSTLTGQVKVAAETVDQCVAGGKGAELCQIALSCVEKGLADPAVCEAATLYSQCIEKEGGLLARHDVHLFVAGVYAFPMIGAIIADRLLGKYHTIIWLSLVYCAGHAVLAVGEDSLMGMKMGLLLIAIGSGGIKPCVSAHVGDQFGKKNWFRIQTVFQMFYFIINFGSFFSTLLIPLVRVKVSTSVAFAIPGVLMFIATIVFWMGRHKFVHIPAKPGGKLGLLDAFSSTLLFLSFGHLFVTTEYDLSFVGYAAFSVGFLVAGLGFLVAGFILFAMRQRIEPDDSFLPVFLYILPTVLWGRRKGQGGVGGAESSAVPGLKADEDMPEDHLWLRKSPIFGAATEKFGPNPVEGVVAVLKIVSIFIFVSMFWALFDQHASSWIEQAKMMDLHGFLPSQIGALNPIMVMALIPITAFAYKQIGKKIEFGPLRRMTVGMFVTSLSFVIAALVQQMIVTQGLGKVDVLWQVLQYLILTLAEVMVSITGLEFAYTQAPKRMKSTIMGFWLLTVALGNVFVAVISSVDIEGKLKSLAGDASAGAAAAESTAAQGLIYFFWFFAVAMAITAVGFAVRARFYTPKSFPQE
jgi:POT family proton-dependent oligopeptide transporter